MTQFGKFEIYIYVCVSGRAKRVVLYRHGGMTHQTAVDFLAMFKKENPQFPNGEVNAKWQPDAVYFG